MTIDQLITGDVVTAWVPCGTKRSATGVMQQNDLRYYRVVKVNRLTVAVETEHGDKIRAYPSVFDRKVSATEWSPWNKAGN